MRTWYRRGSDGIWTLTPPIYWDRPQDCTSSVLADVTDQPNDDDFDYSGYGQACRVRHRSGTVPLHDLNPHSETNRACSLSVASTDEEKAIKDQR